MEKRYFGKLKDGSDTYLYSFTNKNKVTMEVTDLGATLVNLVVPDREGRLTDVVLGYEEAQDYLDNTCFFGAVIGRSGNRIGKARFEINGRTYRLAVNDNENNLHSGPNGYSFRKWTVEKTDEETNSIRFCLNSPDGDQGYPGNFRIAVTYTLTDDNEVMLHYEGCSDSDTIANMTNHSYFNLSGHDSGSMEDQILTLHASCYTPVVDSQAIPNGEIAPVAGTPMDFTEPKPIGRDIEADFEQLKFVGGYDHNFVLDKEAGTMCKMAEAYSEKTGIRMEAFTDCCGVQFYAGNFITDQTGKGGVTYGRRHGFCLESQYFPNAVNQPEFPSPVLKAGEKYDSKTSYRFSVK
ncbi:MAG: aldose epimerase family protein [Candidatus Choladocola sp.]|nr:aldose epimerase family protein [Candidatus Choladocola sp.]